MNRRESREAAFLAMFAWEFNQEFTPLQIYESSLPQDEQGAPYTRVLLAGVGEHLDELHTAIDTYAVGWKRTRISPVSRALIKIALFEMFYLPEIPLRVSLNEAVELSKKYDDEKAYGFVNGLLNAAKDDPRAAELP
ncbi:MAG: transcription antitermination factor NusB [Eubacteriales bacterium]